MNKRASEQRSLVNSRHVPSLLRLLLAVGGLRDIEHDTEVSTIEHCTHLAISSAAN